MSSTYADGLFLSALVNQTVRWRAANSAEINPNTIRNDPFYLADPETKLEPNLISATDQFKLRSYFRGRSTGRDLLTWVDRLSLQ
ncbi:hypothetical protein GWI33_007748 [Rhynchophorus ferrugineus]|uniref:Uncharacterized protein n=1 Tax=Rhynchophorus ferrugineus TaxID=354439 RepID=A0A834ITI2_RHYFE|nr:hypothetical protein GWI33_007748 [Rhynchophorus ferrugineus]